MLLCPGARSRSRDVQLFIEQERSTSDELLDHQQGMKCLVRFLVITGVAATDEPGSPVSSLPDHHLEFDNSGYVYIAESCDRKCN